MFCQGCNIPIASASRRPRKWCGTCRVEQNRLAGERFRRRQGMLPGAKYTGHSYNEGKGKYTNRIRQADDPSGQRLSKANCTLTQWDAFMEECKGCCMICGKRQGSDLTIDHDHKTEKPRGLLCSGCNAGLGNLGDSEEGILKALDYLHRAKIRVT